MKNNPLKDEELKESPKKRVEKEELGVVADNKPADKEEYVEKIKEEAVPFEQQHKPELHVVMAQDDAYIADRIKSQPKTLDEVLLMKERKYSPGEHRLSLPVELRQYQDKVAFRWVNKKKRAIDDAIDLKGWIFINRLSFKGLPNRLFSNSGAIERGDTVLMYMPIEMAMRIRKAPGDKSTALIKAHLAKGEEKLLKGQSGFYKPTEGTSDSDDVPTGEQVYTDGKDF